MASNRNGCDRYHADCCFPSHCKLYMGFGWTTIPTALCEMLLLGSKCRRRRDQHVCTNFGWFLNRIAYCGIRHTDTAPAYLSLQISFVAIARGLEQHDQSQIECTMGEVRSTNETRYFSPTMLLPSLSSNIFIT